MSAATLPSLLLLSLAAAGSAKSSARERPAPAPGEAVLVEAESFDRPGGWALETQFVHVMGSPYLLAHGLGRPVEDATTTVTFPRAGAYKVFVRTKDWVAPWGAPGAPGRFQVLVDGRPLPTTFGATGATWHWQPGGTVQVKRGPVSIALRDLTGFDGRCDAILFTRGAPPPDDDRVLPPWRRRLLGLAARPAERSFDLVVVGGGYAGLGAAVAAARMGVKVALVQDRFVLGGNGSSEVRVWAMGKTPPRLYPVGEIVEEFADRAKSSPGEAEEFGDAIKERLARAEENLTLFLGHRAIGVELARPGEIAAVEAMNVRTAELTRLRGRFFVDATGHGFVGMAAGADRVMKDRGRMGMSNMWRWENTPGPQPFPETPWALPLEEADFPYPRRFHAEWFWESGFDRHPLDELELVRDWNLRAAFGAWNAIKNGGAYRDKDPQQHRNARLTWLAHVGGTRETQQLLGDVVLTREDILTKREFPDAAVLTTWSIDLHEPNPRYSRRFPENPFIAIANHGEGVDRDHGYPIPYRCFYSRNVRNLFMAGRNISVTHEALGTVRVMKTLGMVGVVVGRAAALALETGSDPRALYEAHLPALIERLKLPGAARRTLTATRPEPR